MFSLAKNFHFASRQPFVKASKSLFFCETYLSPLTKTIFKFQFLICKDLMLHFLLTLGHMLDLLFTIPKISNCCSEIVNNVNFVVLHHTVLDFCLFPYIEDLQLHL